MAQQSQNLCSILCIVLLQTVALYTGKTWAQAPGDVDAECQIERFRNTYPEGNFILMDTYNYDRLLGDPHPVWTDGDYDDNNDPNSFFLTRWQTSSGGQCRRSIQSCGYAEGDQNNWVFTQHIAKTTPPNSNIDVEVCVNMTYRVHSCRSRQGCKPVIRVYKYIRNSPISTSAFSSESITRNFDQVFRRTGTLAVSVVDSFCFTVNRRDAGFYLAIRDETSCILLSRMIVYRRQCAAQQVGLLQYPETASSPSGTRTVRAQCVENSLPVSSLNVQCRNDGLWAESTARCQCRDGYRQVGEGENTRCEACPAGTFRSSSDPVTRCIKCPTNTDTSKRAATECACLTGYYRNTGGGNCAIAQSHDGPQAECTAPPSGPTNLRLASTPTDSRISLIWSTPRSSGGRRDVYYTVEYSNPDKVGEFITATASECLTVTRGGITRGLQPATEYLVRVVAHNGVSDEDNNGVFSRKAEITVRTANAPPSAPVEVQGLCNVIVWKRPQRPNGELKSYEVKFFRGSNTITRRLQDDATHYIVGSNDRPSGTGTIRVQVRAINDAGEGIYSAPVANVCPTTDGGNVDPPPIVVSCPVAPACDSCCQCPEVPTCGDNNDDGDSDTTTRPGNVQNVRALNCTTIVWEPLDNHDGKTLQYRIRIYSGRTYSSSRTTERRIFNTYDPWFIPDWLPDQRPVSVVVKGRNSAAQFSRDWSEPVVLTDSTTCPCTE